MASSNLDLAINALVLIRNAQQAIDTALRLPAEDRADLAQQIDAVRRSSAVVAAGLAQTIPGAQELAGASQIVGENIAKRPEFRALSGVVGFFAKQGSEALGAVAGVAGSLSGNRDPSLIYSKKICQRLADVGVATREDLARDIGIDPRSSDFQDGLERALGTGQAEWYGAGTYGLPRDDLETMIGQARDAGAEPDVVAPAEVAISEPAAEPASPALGSAIDELSQSLGALSGEIAERGGEELEPAEPVDDAPAP